MLFGVGLWFTYNRGYQQGYDRGVFEVLDQMERQGLDIEVIEVGEDDRD